MKTNKVEAVCAWSGTVLVRCALLEAFRQRLAFECPHAGTALVVIENQLEFDLEAATVARC